MSQYYYLVPSLPAIKDGSKGPMSFDDFIRLCEGKVGAKDLSLLRSATLDSASVDSPGFLGSWARFKMMMDDELAIARAKRLDRSGYGHRVPGRVDPAVSAAVKKAVSSPDPLEAEKTLLSCQLKWLEDNTGPGHRWDLTFLVGYALRLQLCDRISSLSEDEGRAEFGRILASIQEEIGK